MTAIWAGFLMWKCIISEHFTAKMTWFDMVHVFIVKPQKGPVCISHVFKCVLGQCQYVSKNSVCLHAICLCVKFAFIIMHAEQIYSILNSMIWNWLGYNDQCTNLLIKTQTCYWFPYKCSLVTHTANHGTRMKAGLEFCSSLPWIFCIDSLKVAKPQPKLTEFHPASPHRPPHSLFNPCAIEKLGIAYAPRPVLLKLLTPQHPRRSH